jgi:single-stranded-DNA-specific exonuclease
MSYDNWTYQSRFPSEIIGAILRNRHITETDAFLNPKYEDLISPDIFKDIEKAKSRIIKAISDNETIGIFMDYDADGVCGGAILYKALELMGAKLEYYVPERTEGYGLNTKAIQFFAKKNTKLLLTVDCGVKNHKEIVLANESGLGVIIVDHHQLEDTLPEAVAIIHPKRLKSKLELDLSGGGVAYMLSRAILNDQAQAKWLIDLAAISSVADVVPIVGANRTIVKYGLIVLNKTRNTGLKSLYKVSGLDNKNLGVYDIGFVIAPRLNAAGRVAHPKDAFRLLVSENKSDALEIAEKLNHLNSIRQEKLAKSIKEAETEVLKTKQESDNIIVISGEWHEGIIGLIASRICEKYFRPTIVLTKLDGFLKGSARSIRSVNITDLIGCAKDNLLSFGGHVQAAGLSLRKNQYKHFLKIVKFEAAKIDKNQFIKNLYIDALISPKQLTLKLAEDIEKLQPFGVGNSRPVLALEKLIVANIKIIGKDSNHLKITVCQDGVSHQCLMFDYQNKNWLIKVGDKVDIAFNLSVNEWNNRKNLDLIAEDVKKS